MDSLLSTPYFRDDLLDFTDFDTDTDTDTEYNPYDAVPSSHKRRRVFSLLPCPELVEEEELEWISNKDAFPMVESFVDIVPNHPNIHSANSISGSHLSPVSVLENNGLFPMSIKKCRENGSSFCSENSSVCNDGIGAVISLTGSFKVPGKARSKRLRKPRREISEEQWSGLLISSKTVSKPDTRLKCLHCGSEKTPQWRTGPQGPKTLCNACGVRYKSGRLVPEYRPASSPTFSSELHSNSHRKVVEMRRQKMVGVVGSELKPVEFS